MKETAHALRPESVQQMLASLEAQGLAKVDKVVYSSAQLAALQQVLGMDGNDLHPH